MNGGWTLEPNKLAHVIVDAIAERLGSEIVLLDIMMPGMNGVDVCRSIKADPATRHAQVVAMTGHHSAELEHRVLEAGASVLLKKPFSRDDVLRECGLSALD